MATFDEVKVHNTKLIRKALEGSVFVKPWEEADPPITSLYTAADGLTIPEGYIDVGVIRQSDAIAWNRETGSQDVMSWGYGEPTRRDMTSDVSTVVFTMQESKRQVMELYNGVDLSAVQADIEGNVIVDKPRTPQARRWRMFTLAKDGDGADAVYFLKALPNSQVTAIAEQTWGNETEIAYQTTLTGFYDAGWGTSVREIWGGPGFDAVEAGFLANTP